MLFFDLETGKSRLLEILNMTISQIWKLMEVFGKRAIGEGAETVREK